MEKQFSREDKLIKKLLNEAGTEKPSAELKSRIMMAVESRKAVVTPYTPLIPKFVWYIVTGVILSAVMGLYLMYTEVSFSWSFDFRMPRYIDMPNIRLSQTMQYAIAFIALFFLQVPFLKRFMDRQYQL